MSFLFVVLTVLLGIAIVFTIAFPYLHQLVYRKRFRHIYARKIYRLAMHKDFYLINKLVLKSHDDSRLVVDHLLFGNKYIYVFYDFYCEADLYGKSTDNSFLIKGKKNNSYTDNPVQIAKKQLKELSVLINIDESLFIPIALVNDSCNIINNDESNSLVYLRKLKSAIEYYENKNVKPLNQEQMMFAVHDISCINLRDHKE